MARAILLVLLAFLPCLQSGCNHAPTFDIMGSLFPAWLVCLVFGILLAMVARWMLRQKKVHIVWPVLMYPSLAAVFTFMLWLIFFS